MATPVKYYTLVLVELSSPIEITFFCSNLKGCVIFLVGILPTDGIELDVVREGVTKIPEVHIFSNDLTKKLDRLTFE